MADSGLRVYLASGSRAEDAGYQTAADIALLCAQAGIEYRLIGGLAVSLVHAAHGSPGDLPARQTADADLGADDHAVAASGLDALLLEQGYRQAQGNRFVKGDGAQARAIDILIPSAGGQLTTNVPCGPLTVDAIPGLRLALTTNPQPLSLTVRLSTGETLERTCTSLRPSPPSSSRPTPLAPGARNATCSTSGSSWKRPEVSASTPRTGALCTRRSRTHSATSNEA